MHTSTKQKEVVRQQYSDKNKGVLKPRPQFEKKQTHNAQTRQE